MALPSTSTKPIQALRPIFNNWLSHCGEAWVPSNPVLIQNALENLGPSRVLYQFLTVAYNAKGGCQCR